MTTEVEASTMSSPHFDAPEEPDSPLADGAQWPSLSGAPNPLDSSWEMVSPTTSKPLLDILEATISATEDEAEVVLIPRPIRTPLLRHRSSSTPDLVGMHRSSFAEEEGGDVFGVSKDDSSVPSFRDMVLSKVGALAQETVVETPTKPKPPKKKPKFVVTPTLRCSASTPNLRSLDHFEEEVLGETDACEYYNRKSMGFSGRQNGMKIRPDEAKRKEFTIQKKEMQRQAQKK
eukprot:CAMPEP_0119011420 /NCGR_PEP_ID=MMETSP1176-20130426/5672_1 /TAXON_ID=265551 /ORGANISM="Synedropsis recta cf, Strain CCMP1620" /LENGTH=231 /DNA_ID=CAMNT_0006964251 /DNA_START=282 /DNA_END=977 /DNA_ORIENTATION=+